MTQGARQRHPVMIIRADLAPSPQPRAALKGCSRQQMLLGLPYVHGYVRAFCWSLDRDLVRQLLRGGVHDQPPQQAQVLPGKLGRTEFDEQLLLLSCHPPAQLLGPLPGKPLASVSSTRPYSGTVRPLDGESSVAWDEGDGNRQERRHALEDQAAAGSQPTSTKILVSDDRSGHGRRGSWGSACAPQRTGCTGHGGRWPRRPGSGLGRTHE